MAVAVTAACLAVYAACGMPPSPAIPQQRGDDAGFAIRYERSGGLRPTVSILRIRPGRHAFATTEIPDTGWRTVRFRVSRERIRSLRRSLRRARFGQLHVPASTQCPDCHAYAIDHRGHRVTFTEAEMPRRLRNLVDQLEALITSHATAPDA